MTKHTINVRCCCQPTKILGTIEVDEYHLKKRRMEVICWSPSRGIEDFMQQRNPSPQPRPEEIQVVQFKDLYMDQLNMGSELAAYSEDRPIAFWRLMPSFKEGHVAENPPMRLWPLRNYSFDT